MGSGLDALLFELDEPGGEELLPGHGGGQGGPPQTPPPIHGADGYGG